MKSFFDKFEITSNNSFKFSLKYNLPINGEIGYFEFEWLKEKQYHRLKEILENCQSFDIEANNLKYLPNDIKNDLLILRIWYYDKKLEFPRNWEIKRIDFNSSNEYPIINYSFKCKEISLSSNQKKDNSEISRFLDMLRLAQQITKK